MLELMKQASRRLVKQIRAPQRFRRIPTAALMHLAVRDARPEQLRLAAIREVTKRGARDPSDIELYFSAIHNWAKARPESEAVRTAIDQAFPAILDIGRRTRERSPQPG